MFSSNPPVWLIGEAGPDTFVPPPAFEVEYPEAGRHLVNWIRGKRGQIPDIPVVVGRNEKCPCGSGTKYKRCGLLNMCWVSGV